jgi:methylglutaconyl-CoA hydratase
VRNAFNEELIAELTDWALSVTTGNPHGTRVAVLQGAGKVFCAGADVNWMSKMVDYTREENLRDAERAAAMFNALDRIPVPLIGRIHGAALGGGSGLAAVCNVVVAADDAQFGFTEVVLGILPGMISPYVVRRIGPAFARELCLSGTRFDAAKAKTIGLVTESVPLARLDIMVAHHAQLFLKAAPGAVARAKTLLRQVHGRLPEDVVELTTAAIADQRVSPEGQEGLRAFLEKRAPSWQSTATERKPQ